MQTTPLMSLESELFEVAQRHSNLVHWFEKNRDIVSAQHVELIEQQLVGMASYINALGARITLTSYEAGGPVIVPASDWWNKMIGAPSSEVHQ